MYILLGSVSGTTPGFPLPEGIETLPLNWDLFTDFVLNFMHMPFFDNFLDNLDGQGENEAAMIMAALPPGYVGLVMYFAYALNNPFDFVSNPVEIEIVP